MLFFPDGGDLGSTLETMVQQCVPKLLRTIMTFLMLSSKVSPQIGDSTSTVRDNIMAKLAFGQTISFLLSFPSIRKRVLDR